MQFLLGGRRVKRLTNVLLVMMAAKSLCSFELKILLFFHVSIARNVIYPSPSCFPAPFENMSFEWLLLILAEKSTFLNNRPLPGCLPSCLHPFKKALSAWQNGWRRYFANFLVKTHQNETAARVRSNTFWAHPVVSLRNSYVYTAKCWRSFSRLNLSKSSAHWGENSTIVNLPYINVAT